jgi:hypothetical protein
MMDKNLTVIALLDRAIQYAAAPRLFSGLSGMLDSRFRGDDNDAGTSSMRKKPFGSQNV